MVLKSSRLFISAVMVAAGMALGGQGHAAPKPAPVIRIVDVQEVMEKSTAVMGIKRELDTYRKRYDEEFAAKEKLLKAEETELLRQKTILGEQAFREKAQEFQTKFIGFQNEIKVRQQMLQKAYATSINRVSVQVQKIWADVAAAEGATIMLPRAGVLLFEPAYDVTGEVLARLNKALPSVAFPDPMGGGNEPAKPGKAGPNGTRKVK